MHQSFVQCIVRPLHPWGIMGTLIFSSPQSPAIFLTAQSLIDTVIILNFRTDRSGQTVQTQIRLEEQSDQGLHCLLFH